MPGFNSKISYDPTNHLTLINLEQSDCVTRRTAERQHLIREDARSRLRGVTAAISAELNAARANPRAVCNEITARRDSSPHGFEIHGR